MDASSDTAAGTVSEGRPVTKQLSIAGKDWFT
jgi:hypothetical protein